MKNRILAKYVVFLLAIFMCFQTTVNVHAASINPSDTATEENVLEVLRKYDADAYHIMKTEADSGSDFLMWFSGGSIISQMDTAIHETYHGYTFNQRNKFYSDRIYLGGGKSYDVDHSVADKGGNFTKTEEMAKHIPSNLRTARYDIYVATGETVDANTRSVFGLLNEFTAYYWDLEVMNSLSQFLIDTNAREDAWKTYVRNIGSNMIAYAEFKYWTLRYMLYIKSVNPSLYQTILKNKNYCMAYRDADAKFISEIARSKRIINNCNEYLYSKGYSVDWSDSGIYLKIGSRRSGVKLDDYSVLMAELETSEYIEMDSILKNTNSKPTGTSSQTPSFHAALSSHKLSVNGVNVNCEKYNINGNNYFKLRDIAYLLRGTTAQFSIVWDPASRSIKITSDQTYIPDGSELVMNSADKSKSAVRSNQSIIVNGKTVSNLAVYSIGGNNYFKLRDLADILGFEVGYIPETKTATITY